MTEMDSGYRRDERDEASIGTCGLEVRMSEGREARKERKKEGGQGRGSMEMSDR